jgi:hypothetical protein
MIACSLVHMSVLMPSAFSSFFVLFLVAVGVLLSLVVGGEI